MNNIVNNPKTLARLWAALSCDFESLLAKFMASKGWRYIHFAAICRQMEITLVMHITQGRGKTKDEHYHRITDMIFQLAKDLWLRPIENSNQKQPKSMEDYEMELKRSLGGFFLLYTMYQKQPCKGKVKISLGLQDMKAYNIFCEKMKRMVYYHEAAFMLYRLQQSNAFYYCIFSETYRFEAPTRNFLSMSQSDVVTLTKKMRDAQDVLLYSPIHEHAEERYRILSEMKNDMARDMIKTLDPTSVRAHFRGESMFQYFVHAVNSGSFVKAMTKLDALLDKPIMTLQALTATEAIDRRIMMETRQRMERARKKATQSQQPREGEQKATRPYVREGGIFGRKKETEEGEDKTKRRERGACNGNLWIFINGLDFDKPLMASGEPVPDPLAKLELKDENIPEEEEVPIPAMPIEEVKEEIPLDQFIEDEMQMPDENKFTFEDLLAV